VSIRGICGEDTHFGALATFSETANELFAQRQSLSAHYVQMEAAIYDVFEDALNPLPSRKDSVAGKVSFLLEHESTTPLFHHGKSRDDERLRQIDAAAHAIPLVMRLDRIFRQFEAATAIKHEDFLLRRVSGYNFAESIRRLGHWVRHQDEIVDRTDKHKQRLADNLRFFSAMRVHAVHEDAAARILCRYGFRRYNDLEAHILLGLEWTLTRNGRRIGVLIGRNVFSRRGRA